METRDASRDFESRVPSFTTYSSVRHFFLFPLLDLYSRRGRQVAANSILLGPNSRTELVDCVICPHEQRDTGNVVRSRPGLHFILFHRDNPKCQTLLCPMFRMGLRSYATQTYPIY
jgi:hypothetical protein